MKKYKNLNLGEIREVIDIEKFKREYPLSLTDASYFVPTAEANKTIDKTKLMSHDPSLYDYADGIDTGTKDRLASIRKPGKDIAEIQEEAMKMAERANESINNDIKSKIDTEMLKKQQNKANIKEMIAESTTKTTGGTKNE